MCGIIGYTGPRNSCDVLIDGLSKLEYRGYDSAGIAVFENGNIDVTKAMGRLSNLVEKIEGEGRHCGNCGIGHTRWATHGEPSDVNSHPHSSSRISIVHNGIIENYLDIKEFLLSKGYTFESETDTETVVKLLDYYYDGNPIDTIKKVLDEIRGAYALGILFKDFPDTIYALRKDSPLIVGRGEKENFIASDVPAILKYTRNYNLLEENEIAVITDKDVVFYNNWGEQIYKETLHADWDIEAAEKGGYPHFTLKEIHEQPTAIKSTVSPRLKDGLPSFDSEGLTDEFLGKFSSIHIVACGTAMYAGLMGRDFIESIARIPVTVEMASEFRYRDPIFSPDKLILIISQSGETADSLAALRLAKAQGAETVAIVNVVGSSIARDATHVIYTWAGPEIGVASTKAYTVQVATLFMLAVKLGLANGNISSAEGKDYMSALTEVPEMMEQVLKLKDDVQHFASLFMNTKDLFFVGRGIDYALCQEGSLKLKELSYIHSEAYAAGELKHGPIALISDGTPVIALATQPKLYEKVMSNIKEVKARGAKVLLICSDDDTEWHGVSDYMIEVPKFIPVLSPLVSAITVQLFAYYTALLKGCDVDKPRNLAKSVTVE